MPTDNELDEQLCEVLAVLYLMFNEGYLASGGDVPTRRDLALRQVAGPEAALIEVNVLAQDLDHYHLFHAVRAELLLELSEREQARASALRALELTQNSAEQSLLARRLLQW